MKVCQLVLSTISLLVVAGLTTSSAQSEQRLLPTYPNIAYAPAEPIQSRGHLLDIYLPPGHGTPGTKPVPVLIWTGGSGWKGDNDKSNAGQVAAQLNPVGIAVVGVSIRSSAQTTFPGQLYDIKAAIRWVRTNAAGFDLDPDRIGIMGGSSGGWAAAMAAVTGDRSELEGKIGTLGVSSAVQAAIAFSAPTDFLPGSAVRYSARSPATLLLGCPPQTCPEKALAASPARYVTGREPPIMILHGELDQKVPNKQGELLYDALEKACSDAAFISLPNAGHGPFDSFLTSDVFREGATIRSTSASGCRVINPTPFKPTWGTIIDFLNRYLRA